MPRKPAKKVKAGKPKGGRPRLPELEEKREAIAQLLTGKTPEKVALSLRVDAGIIARWFNELSLEDFAAHLKPLLQRAIANSLQSFETVSKDTGKGSAARYHRENATAGWRLLAELEAVRPKQARPIASSIPVADSD